MFKGKDSTRIDGMARICLLVISVSVFLIAVPSSAETQLFAPDAFLSLSSKCSAALSANLSCNIIETGNTMYQLTVNLTADLLDQMCTEQCSSSIASYRESVQEACADDEYDDTGNSTIHQGSSGVYRPIVLPDYYFTNYDQRCLKDSDGKYCFISLQSDDQDECNECGIKMFQTELDNGYFYNDDLADLYNSLTSSCHLSTLTLPTPTPVVITSSSVSEASPTACSGRIAVIQPGDTCDTFAAANNISTFHVLMENGLQSGCLDFPTTGTLCITGSCQTHLAKSNDTCMSLASQYNITITQFRTWNPLLNGLCSNFDIVTGHQVCVSNPGNETSEVNTYATSTVGATAATPAPVPTDIAQGTNTMCGNYYLVKENDYCQAVAMAQGLTLSDFYFLNPELDVNCTNLWVNYSYCIQPVGNIETYSGYTTATGTSTSSRMSYYTGRITGTPTPWDDLPDPTNLTPWTPIATPITAPLANGTRLDCEEYKDNYFGTIPCTWLANEASDLNFADWNPSVDMYNCTLTNNTRYCTLLGEGYDISLDSYNDTTPYADVPSTAAVNSTQNCYEWYTTAIGVTCDTILSSANISLAAFYAWNPSVNSDCSNLWLNTSYCIIGTGYDDAYYSGSFPSSTSTAASTTTGCPTATVTPPGPTQTGIPCDCNAYAAEQDGVYCADMAMEYGITLDELYEWNPALNGDCSGLWAGYAYCVGIAEQSTTTSTSTATTATSAATCAAATPPGPTQTGIPCDCDEYLMQKDGLYCYDMAAEADITLDELYEWNPALNGDCSGLWEGYAYCVGVI